ncbi:dinuclear metal center protein, YbgI family [Peptoanaerobacter stomatis]|uniref:GTP cyclohydrolase 1 type 2 homolog n=1 Tax=Peptoanaerobacter stomatis TaxID=796937 RepID=J5WIE3_9FIRM|nr:Nif3-like dinuclear metal center hexameric protein [Peptoanaerobacter stomatis]EJU22157.1 dinuclear metal center protein, YbgI family [Peptoanaerobacter stomatis]NWO24908.1 Nif3-like dinuclear metal center hexameric protein [Peptostreptococcaceae bacterium oral taxon 081]
MKLGELTQKLDIILRKDIACNWDNVGLLVGELDSEVTKITLSLELCDNVIDDAIKNGSNLIITHHPLIFSPIKTVISGELKQKWIIKLIKNNIALYTAHTNFDLIRGGLNDHVISLLDVKDILPLGENFEDYYSEFGRIATLNKPMYAFDLLKYLQEKLKINDARLISKNNKLITKIALVTGSGSEFIDIGTKKADLYITGDLKYHESQDLYQSGLSVIDAGHYGTEKHFGDAMQVFLKKNLHENIEIYISTSLDNPFKQVSGGFCNE